MSLLGPGQGPPPDVTFTGESPDAPVLGERLSVFAAATYGPTNGPPLASAPAGSVEFVDASVTARPRFSRPLPVWSSVPTASADSASRLTTTPFAMPGVAATTSA